MTEMEDDIDEINPPVVLAWMKKSEVFHFLRPEEAPVFTPTNEEFKDPLAYINKIRPQAEAAGICKIKPPTNWQPPFALDVDRFKFTPRVQRLNELEAKTRIKLNFLGQIAKFWALQGSSLKIPTIEKKAVDLYTLHKLVKAEGGKDKVNNDKKWNRLAVRMGYNPQKSHGALLKSHYEKILFPYDRFKKEELHQCLISGAKLEVNSPKKGSTQKPSPTKRMRMVEKMAKYVCYICNGGDAEEKMLLCDGCDDRYHTFCLQPPLPELPKGEWQCPKCVAEEVGNPGEAFGFEEAKREYTLQQFGEMADQFKSDYFNMPGNMVTSELVEKEFWRIVSAIDEVVTVEYGADLHSMDHGSGFPTVSQNIEPHDAVYCKNGWNLNNLPVLKGSVLGHINADISGMKVPWMYVGMCFSTFCWHNEDHWNYSINYLHWGEPKTWYGVPGSRANDFEIAMKQAAPELFHSQPDLLHQLVTILNPNILMLAGVPVYRMDQKAGEFMITFPRAYHAGFNQGYNFAEAVNFAPADWLAMGRDCITHYSNLHRYCVFSHDELICKMAHDYEKLDKWMALWTYKDMAKMLEIERELRKGVLNWGVARSERVKFEMIPDDNRLCQFCQTTCFLSAIACPCTENELVCLRHYDKLCQCSGRTHILKYRYTLDEIPLLIKKLQQYTVEYENWVRICRDKVATVRKIEEDEKIDMEDLKRLVEEAKRNNYPNSQITETVKQIACEAEQLSKIAKFLTSSNMLTRKSASRKPTYSPSELQILLTDLIKLPIKVKETKLIEKLINQLEEMNTSADYYIAHQESGEYDSKQIKQFLDDANQLPVEIPNLQPIQTIYKRLKWLESIEYQGLWNLNQLRQGIESGRELPHHPTMTKKLKYLCFLKEFIESWEENAQRILMAKKEKFTLEDVEPVLNEAISQPIAPRSLPLLRELVLKTNLWLQKVKLFKNKSEYPYNDDLEILVAKGEAFPLYLGPLNILRSQVHGTKLWKEMCAHAFLKKISFITLIEALIPRREIRKIPILGKRKHFGHENSHHQLAAMLLGLKVQDLKVTGEIAKAYENCQKLETEKIISLRNYNLAKKLYDTGESLYCICQKPFGEFMIRCELCCEWFHVSCVPLPIIEPLVSIPEHISRHAYVAHKISEGDIKYFGPCCARSKRPKLDTMLDLLAKLQTLPVKTVEGEALYCLTQRATTWMDKTKEFLAQDDVAAALKTIKSSVRRMRNLVTYEGSGAHDEIKMVIDQNGHDTSPYWREYIFEDSVLKMEDMGIADAIKCEDSNDNSGDLIKESSPSISTNGTTKKVGSCDKSKARIPQKHLSDNKSTLDHNFGEVNLKNVGISPFPLNFGGPLAKLSPIKQAVAENLLVEVALMEVSVAHESADISDDIWRLVEGLKSQPSRPGVCLEKLQEVIDKEINETEAAVCPQDESLPGSLHNAKMILRKPVKRKLTFEEKIPSAKALTEEYDGDDCAANPCKQPLEKGLTWVQCEAGCDHWFHIKCVGLKKSQVKKMDTFLCKACTLKDKSNQNTCASDGYSYDRDSKFSDGGKASISSDKEEDKANIDNFSLPSTKVEERDKCLFSL